jgi:hypothetical protein
MHPISLENGRSAGIGLALLLCLATPAQAKPEYGEAVDVFCTGNARIPARPFDGDCAICHDPDSSSRARTPGFDAYKSHKGDGDFSYFCPVSDAPNEPPRLDPIGDQRVDEGGLLELRITASDPEGGALRLEVADLPTGAVFQDNGDGTADFVWMPDHERAGNYPVLFKASDSASPPASVSETITITVGDVNRPPRLDPVGNRSAAVAARLAFALSATDPDRDPLRFGASGLPEGAVLIDLGNGSAEFDWTPSAANVGNHAVTFSVTDAGTPMQSDDESIVITVGEVNRPPELAPIGGQVAYPGALLVVDLMATDPDGDALRFSIEGVPEGASVGDAGDGTAQILWTPGADQTGNYTLTCRVIDDGVPAEMDAEAFTISVGDVNRPPRLEPLVLMEDGPVLTIALTASDPDGDALRFEATGVPTDASFVDHGDGTAEFRWEPAADLAGDFPLDFEVRDDGIPPESDTSGTVITLAAPPEAAASSSGSKEEEWESAWGCGIGFELCFVLPPLMWARRRLRRDVRRARRLRAAR